MAIQFARARYISRSSGGSAVRSAAYNARAAIEAVRTGELFYFKHRDAPEHHEVLLPDGAAERFHDCGVLWNAAEAAEKRKDAQVAREIVLALPADAALSDEDRIALARSFAVEHFVAHGLAVQLDVHCPHDAPAEGETDGTAVNWHAHLLITTRRLEGEGFSARKARDLDPTMRRAGGKNFVAEGEAWGALWREHQDRFFREHGLDLRVDAIATHPGAHIGPVRMRRAGSQAVERAAALRAANEDAAHDPAQVLATLTRGNATFGTRDLERYLAKHLKTEAERAAAKAAVLRHPSLLALHDRASGALAGRWTTRAVRAQEIAALRDGAALAAGGSGAGVGEAAAEAVLADRSLRPDQQAAFAHALAPGGLKLIEGRAGTGKSYTLQAVRDAHERAGLRVVGLAPTNAVAQDLAQDSAKDGFAEAGTVHAALFRLKNGLAAWDARTAVIVDEAAMLDSRVMGELLDAARASGAKLILAGDDRQLASIERGGLFTALKERHGAAAIVEVTRQREAWQREAARDLAEGRFEEAVASFDRHGAITWTADEAAARAALVASWTRDAEEKAGSARFVFAYTNRDVDAFNLDLRQVRRARGELAGADVMIETAHGALPFAVGDRVQLTATLKSARLYNGNVGTLTAIDAATGAMRAVLDGGREVAWSASEFAGFRHGYAGTIYKGQGKTLDHTYLFHTHHWRSAASYVALTRQRESAQVFVATDTARDARQLARQMGRGEVRAASVAWVTGEEIAAAGRASRARALQERVAALQAETGHHVAAQASQEAGAPTHLQARFRTTRAKAMLAPVLDASASVIERNGPVIRRMAGLVMALPKALELIRARAAEAAQRAERERAQRADLQAGVAAFRERFAARRREEERLAQEAREQRLAQARTVIEAWDHWLGTYNAALPTLLTDPAMKGAREMLILFGRSLANPHFYPEGLDALRMDGAAFGMEQRPTLARLLTERDPEAFVTATLDGCEARQRAELQAEAERKAALDAQQRRQQQESAAARPRSSSGPSPW